MIVFNETKFSPSDIKSVFIGFSKLPRYEIDIIEYCAKEEGVDKIGRFLLYFLRVYENGNRGNEYNISNSWSINTCFRQQCRDTCRIINKWYSSSVFNFFYKWTKYQKECNLEYNKDSYKMYIESKKLGNRLFKKW